MRFDNGLVDTATAPRSDSAQGDSRISVCLLISSLEFGGAERQVVELVRSFDRSRVLPFACSLSGKVPLAACLPNRAEDLCIVQKYSRFDLTTVPRVAKILRERRVDVVHAFLLDAEIVARLAAPLARVPVVIASERNADYTRPMIHRLALRLTEPLFDVMVANSHAGKAFNIRTLGLSDSRIEVVPNGVDTGRFRPDDTAGLALRQELGIASAASVVGMVGSFKPQKGHANFLRVAAKLRASVPDISFIIVGEPFRDDSKASHDYKAKMVELARTLQLDDRCLFLGRRTDMKAVYNACDVTVLLSHLEGTPNAVLESMACGVPVVVSDIADNRMIVANGINGYVVPPADVEDGANRVQTLLCNSEKQAAFGLAARESAMQDFSFAAATTRLEDIYRSCLRRKAASNCSLPGERRNSIVIP